jgi:2-hydroxy-3-keto-5-methylthiopentenyl-1-phosphate phosphatase
MQGIMSAFILIDFDGTIVRQDATDLILERFAQPEWRAVEQDWVTGRIGSRECLARQIDLVRATEDDLEGLISELEIDPAFPAFVSLCQELGFDAVIGSDGLDRVISRVLARAGLDLPFVSNRLAHTGNDRWRVDFPHFDRACSVLSGTCKCATAARSALPTVLVGDGRSDFCIAARAQWVLAKGSLAQHCRKSGIPHVAIDGFADAVEALRSFAARLPGMKSTRQHAVPADASHA